MSARSRYRLGRRRSHSSRRAEGCESIFATHRPCQSPHGRAFAKVFSCRETAPKFWNAARRNRQQKKARKTRFYRAPVRSTFWRSTFLAWHVRRHLIPMISLPKSVQHLTTLILSRQQFDRAVAFVSTGGYALRTYDRFAKLKPTEDGKLRVAHPRFAPQYRLNVGTIVDSSDAEGSSRLGARGQKRCADGRQGSRRGRRIFRGAASAWRDVRVRRTVPSRVCATPKCSSPARRVKTPWCRATAATNFRCRRIWQRGCAQCWLIHRRGRGYLPPSATGSSCKAIVPFSPPPTKF